MRGEHRSRRRKGLVGLALSAMLLLAGAWALSGTGLRDPKEAEPPPAWPASADPLTEGKITIRHTEEPDFAVWAAIGSAVVIAVLVIGGYLATRRRKRAADRIHRIFE